MMKNVLLSLLACSALLSCENQRADGPNKFSDPLIARIYDLADRRSADSLYSFFNDNDPVIRREAALMFASIQDTSAVEKLGRVLIGDADASVRAAAAYAIGQTPSAHSERIVLGAMHKEKDASVMRELLEAYGKTTTHWQMVNHPDFHDTVRSEGLAWSIYRAGLRQKTDSASNIAAAELLDTRFNINTRLGAAHYFARSARNIDAQLDVLSKSATQDPSADVRMAAAHALRKIKTPASLETLKNIIEKDENKYVQINAVRALQGFDFADSRNLLMTAVRSKHAQLSTAASEVIKAIAAEDDWLELANTVDRIQNWRAAANLYEAILKPAKHNAVQADVIARYNSTANEYEKAFLLPALQWDLSNYDFLKAEIKDSNPPVVRTAAATALTNLLTVAKSDKAFKAKFAQQLPALLQSEDPAIKGILASPIGDSTLAFRDIIRDFSFLEEARGKLSLPQDVEAIQPIDDALAYLKGEKRKVVKTEFNHPVDWAFVRSIPRDQTATIQTSRGNIVIRFDVEASPGSVANFVQLAKADYFDNKVFHRVVPNFVVQGGCKRGDGSGSEAYSIRSEFGPDRYTSGSVGMASAGKDTEGTQWFITHTPTPHLDGRYTIFAEVVSGMDAVSLIEVGDKIMDVRVSLPANQ